LTLAANARVSATGLVDCQTDDKMQARANRLLARSDHAAIEIWDGGRQVYYAKKLDTARDVPQ
jgi:hypothetical protein